MNSNKLTTDNNDPELRITEPDGQYKKYLVLSEEERSKGFVQPIRDKYVHKVCGCVTGMNKELVETYARNPNFYSGTYCCSCGDHFPLKDDGGNYNFYWDIDGTGVGEITTEEEREYSKVVTRVALEQNTSEALLQLQRKNSIYNKLLSAIDEFKNSINDYSSRLYVKFDNRDTVIMQAISKLDSLLMK
jgi:hypothetical protein